MEHAYLNAINLFGKLGPQKISQLLVATSTFEEIWKAQPQLLLHTRLPETLMYEFIAFRKTIDVEKEWMKLEKERIQMILLNPSPDRGEGKARYPLLLQEIYSPPVALYVRGTLPDPSLPTLAIVGSRKMSSYGAQVTPDIAGALAGAGIVIISGLALGVDSMAHQSAVEKNTPTIAVLGCSVNDSALYPISNRLLAKRILEINGAIISEYPLGTAPLKQHFPARNRIISGMSLGVLIIEASNESGSLLTARHALDQNREVFAIPGSIYSQTSEGTNNLIKMGAHCVTCAHDILDVLNIATSPLLSRNSPITPDSYEESLILPHLSKTPTHIDELALRSTLDMQTFSATLTLMEMKGIARNLGGMMYVRAR